VGVKFDGVGFDEFFSEFELFKDIFVDDLCTGVGDLLNLRPGGSGAFRRIDPTLLLSPRELESKLGGFGGARLLKTALKNYQSCRRGIRRKERRRMILGAIEK